MKEEKADDDGGIVVPPDLVIQELVEEIARLSREVAMLRAALKAMRN